MKNFTVIDNFKELFFFLKDLYNSRELIKALSKNDFKVKFAGSYLGILWAFVQPIMTILVFWFVFQIGFKSTPVEGVPFILWLVTGLIPWFFFSDAWILSTNCLIEYSYLVKKVVFRVSVLPLVKILSSLFVHVFFIYFIVLLFWIYGYGPQMIYIQVLYYTFCMIILIFGLSFITSSIIVFFKDIGQILSIVLQFAMWLTPIIWSEEMIPQNFRFLFEINPMYYIVSGYRSTFINNIWFWSRSSEAIYFWVVTSIIFVLGASIFRRLRPHFSDVL